MNASDRRATDLVRKLADDMMNAKPMVNPVVRNTDIIEALIGDLGSLANGSEPKEMVRLAEQAIEAGEMTRPDYLPAAKPDAKPDAMQSDVARKLGRVFPGFN